ncbi:MAG: MBL fold metallo-hydrolase [Proteobacteria bacterium]|nr:MBL fold metallo-hydrolase [Pseudomonadota bacterium]
MTETLFTFIDSYQNFIRVWKDHVPAYIYDHEQPVMFDPGVSAFGPLYYRKLLETVSGRTDNLFLLLTHSHFDHCGAVPYLLRKFPDAKVGASIKAAEVLQKQSAIALIRRLNAEYEKEMAEELKGEDTSFSAITVDLQLKEGDKVEVQGGKSFQVFETPGHTRDCLSYFFPDSGVLLAGEATGVPEGDFIHSAFLASYEDYVTSIEKLRTLNAEALCIAHVGILTGRENVQVYLSQSLQATKEYREKIERYLEKFQGDREKVVETITAEEYDLTPDHIIKRTPFMINLQAKVNVVYKLLGT